MPGGPQMKTGRTVATFSKKSVSRPGVSVCNVHAIFPRIIHVGGGTFAEVGAAEVVTIVGKTLKITHYGATRFEGERAP
jgi:hypothetical protein